MFSFDLFLFLPKSHMLVPVFDHWLAHLQTALCLKPASLPWVLFIRILYVVKSHLSTRNIEKNKSHITLKNLALNSQNVKPYIYIIVITCQSIKKSGLAATRRTHDCQDLTRLGVSCNPLKDWSGPPFPIGDCHTEILPCQGNTILSRWLQSNCMVCNRFSFSLVPRRNCFELGWKLDFLFNS